MGPFTITLANCGGQAFEVYGDEVLLDALEERGVSLPYGCRYGGCITCAARLVAGEVDQSEGVALKPYQLAEGYVLLCVAYPKSDCTLDIGVESHDRLYRNPFANPIYDEKMITGDRVEPRDLEQKP
ncbi:MAG: 2Fe-2S iron-sulfur cluster-binding protein [Methyloligellaceae bacterium]